MDKYIPITGKVTLQSDGTGSDIVGPEHGTTGYWTPSDQAVCPVTPVPVTWFGGYGWVSSTIFPTFKP